MNKTEQGHAPYIGVAPDNSPKKFRRTIWHYSFIWGQLKMRLEYDTTKPYVYVYDNSKFAGFLWWDKKNKRWDFDRTDEI